MKRLAGIILLFCSAVSYGTYWDPIIGIIYPEIDFKYVEFLPVGHLHKNKPRYGEYDWKVRESAHFELYAYGDKELASVFLEEAENIYNEFSEKFDMRQFSEKIRVAVFNSSRDFEETNLVFGLVPEGLGGQTEMIKRKRVLVAFRDSLTGFRRLLRHELVHRYQSEFLKMKLTDIFGPSIPLWFVEGAAECFAHPWDSRGEMVMRDGYLNDYLAKATDKYWWRNSLIYKQGEFTVRHLVEKYSHKGDVVNKILAESRKIGFEKAFESVTGKTLEEFEKELRRHIEERYRELRLRTDIADKTKVFSKDAALLASRDNFFVTRKIIFGRNTLFINWTDGGKTRSKKLAESGRLKSAAIRGFDAEISPEFGFQEHGASFVSSSAVVYSLDKGGRDAIVIRHFSFDLAEKRFQLGEKEEYSVDSMRDIQYPVAVSDDEIAFVGRKAVFAELFVFNKKTKETRQLTSARRTYRGLSYSKSLNVLATSAENENTNSYDLALYDFKTGELRLLAETEENEFCADFSPDGKKLLYVSDKGLAHNIFLYDSDNRAITKLTDARIGVLRPKWFGSDGMLFNSFMDAELFVKSAPLPFFSSSNEADASSNGAGEKDKAVPDSGQKAILSEFEFYLPDAESLAVFKTIVSSDGAKALFLVNRKLSMRPLEKGEPEIGFYAIDLSARKAVWFTVSKFRRLKDFEGAELLAGPNILFRKTIKVTHFNPDEKDSWAQWEEITYQEIYVYNWETGELSRLTDNSRFFKISPGRRYLFFVKRDKAMLYDVLRSEIVYEKEIDEFADAEFISETELLIIKKEFRGIQVRRIDALKVRRIDVLNKAEKEFEIASPNSIVSWHFLAVQEKIFFVARDESNDYKVILSDVKFGTSAVIRSGIPSIENAKIENGKLVIESKNKFGMKRTLVLDEKGQVSAVDEAMPYETANSSQAVTPAQYLLEEKSFSSKMAIAKRLKDLSRFPKLYSGQGTAAIVVSNRGADAVIALQALALDELNNKAAAADILLQNNYGFANIGYYNFVTGRSWYLDYWNFDGFRQKLAVGVFQNIFFHPFVNWDIGLREEYGRIGFGDNVIKEWWRTRIGTTFSVDTTKNDWHGPHSGVAAFSGIEISVDSRTSRYRAIDLNMDARYYWPITERSGIALRAAAGRSFGPDPTIFIWGGNKTFRGVSLFSQAGNAYVLQSAELRFPVFDVAGAKISGPIDEVFWFITRYMDVRGGLYNDIGDIWWDRKFPYSNHKEFKLQHSAGIFINVPTVFGVNLRFSKDLFGKKKNWDFWLGYNW